MSLIFPNLLNNIMKKELPNEDWKIEKLAAIVVAPNDPFAAIHGGP